jgi:hypothetical protein
VATVKTVGHKPPVLGIVLWLLVSGGSLWLIGGGGLDCEEGKQEFAQTRGEEKPEPEWIISGRVGEDTHAH